MTERPPAISIVRQTPLVTTVRALITPFGTPMRRDLSPGRDWFDTKTYFGDELYKTKPAFYDHHLNAAVNEVMRRHPEKQLLGVATFKSRDEWGRWFEIEVDRALEYHDFIMEMIEMGILGASTQAFAGSVIRDVKSGYVSRWLESEVTLTPQPANYDTIDYYHQLIKKWSTRSKTMPEETAKTAEQESGTPVTDLEASLAAAAAALVGDPAPATEQVAVDDLMKAITEAVAAAVAPISAQVAAIMVELKRVETNQKAQSTALTTFSEAVVKSAQSVATKAAANVLKRSPMEQQAINAVQQEQADTTKRVGQSAIIEKKKVVGLVARVDGMPGAE